jgi:hypothetical protein
MGEGFLERAVHGLRGMGMAVTIAGVAGFPVSVPAAACSATSPAHSVALVELYTSEGCSSCPPADAWLSTLLAPDGGAAKLVPLAFHVDYWDYIGWKDPYGQSRFGQRQRETAGEAGSRTLYTPQVRLQSKDFRAWAQEPAFRSAVEEIIGRPAAADLSLELRRDGPSGWNVYLVARTRQPGVANKEAVAFVAIYEDRLESRVPAGENAGRTLHHDHVVRQWLGPFPIGASGRLALSLPLHLEPNWDKQNLGVAAVAFASPSGPVLQALSLPWCRG